MSVILSLGYRKEIVSVIFRKDMVSRFFIVRKSEAFENLKEIIRVRKSLGIRLH